MNIEEIRKRHDEDQKYDHDSPREERMHQDRAYLLDAYSQVKFQEVIARQRIEELESRLNRSQDLPKWTLITDDPFSWPQHGAITLMRTPAPYGNGWARPWVQLNTDTFYHGSSENQVYWRPLCSLDCPPEKIKGEGDDS